MKVQAINASSLNFPDAADKDVQCAFSNARTGDEVEGVITGVSGEISINFSGRVIKFPKTTVLNAKEGESKKFKIMDISKERIVLKEVGISTNDRSVAEKSQSIKDKMDSYYDKHGNKNSTDRVSRDKSESVNGTGRFNKCIRILGSCDIKKIEQNGKLIENMSTEELRAAMDKIWNNKNSDNNNELSEKSSINDENVDNMAPIHTDLGDKLNNNSKSSEQSEENVDNLLENMSDIGEIVAQYIEMYDSSFGTDKINLVENAMNEIAALLNMPFADGGSNGNIIDMAAAKYLAENDLPLTVGNVYKAMHAGVYNTPNSISEEEFSSISSQIEDIITDAGMELNNSNIEKARWLINNNLPVNSTNLKKLNDIDCINEYSVKDILENVISGIKNGEESTDILLSYSKNNYEEIVNSIGQITDSAIEMVIEENNIISIKELSRVQREISNESFASDSYENNYKNAQYIKEKTDKIEETKSNENNLKNNKYAVRRMLEEIRLKMSADTSYKLAQKGIDIRTSEISKVVEELASIENSYINELAYAEGVDSSQVDTLSEITQIADDMRKAPAIVLAKTLSVQDTITLRGLHEEAVNTKLSYSEETYEKLMTKPRTDLGDSINKAFRNVDNMLNDLGMEINIYNQRAVRILGYNNMDITVDSVQQMKSYDMKVNEMLSNLVPKAAVELIKSNKNPLDMTVEELNAKLVDIKRNDSEMSNEKYSEFLWRMDNNNELTMQERESFVGIYRLVNAINSSGGAVIGATINAGMELTLSNLLTSYRTGRNKGIDVNIDNEFGEIESVKSNGKSISQMINSSFLNSNKNINEGAMTVLRSLEDVLTPECIKKMDKSGIDYTNISIEKLLEGAQEFADNVGNKRDKYYEQKLEKLKDVIAENEAACNILNKIGSDITVNNMLSAINLQNGTGLTDSIKKLLKNNSNKVISSEDETDNNTKFGISSESIDKQSAYEEEKDILASIIENLPSDIISKEDISKRYEEMSEIISDIINKEKKNGSLGTEGFEQLRMLGRNMEFALNLNKNEFYEIPLVVGESITNVNLTVINNGSTNNQVKISVDLEKLGKINAEFIINNNRIKGLILAESKKSLDVIKDNLSGFRDSVEQEELEVGNIDYGILGRHTSLEISNNNVGVSNKKLYSIARAIIINIKNTENTKL